MQKITIEGNAAVTKRRLALSLPRRTTVRRYLLFFALIAPAFILRFITAAYPIAQTVLYSFTNYNLLKGTNEFIGFENYSALTTDFGVRGALSFTIVYVLASTFIELAVGMMIALLLNANFRGRAFARTINLIPWAIPTIVAGYAFRWFLDDQFGLLTNWINAITGKHMLAFIDPTGAKLSVILVHVWKDAPFMAIIFLAGMQGVPEDLYEAAKIDGASAWQRFWSITIPLVKPLVITMTLFRIVWSLSGFDLVYGLTSGGPGVATSVLALQVFREGILYFKFGFASAISVVLLLFVALVGIIALRLYRRADVAY
ncbi:MAG TPA: sugar ABC transporter permease [Aggregatilinea sp.]|uniref:carbohydrate ABC transporter permease n=1 Tax=Aggregatilinea sp. TaxID=2806333 RepID=UPI002C7764EE|nr:sugar ABC transporter permease [Aggregatilinea sp.]HML22275.1 sugar ABC transporter permease [Aggregatilinea sp.]